jgi:hypothetical protein
MTINWRRVMFALVCGALIASGVQAVFQLTGLANFALSFAIGFLAMSYAKPFERRD